jgi:hypothetical protein
VEDIWVEGLERLLIKPLTFDWLPFFGEGHLLMITFVLTKMRRLGAFFGST